MFQKPEPFQLPDEARHELLDRLGFDTPGVRVPWKDSKFVTSYDWELKPDAFNALAFEEIALRDVQILLGQYPFDVALLDQFPTSIPIRDRLSPLIQEIDTLRSRLLAFDEMTRELLEVCLTKELTLDQIKVALKDDRKLGEHRGPRLSDVERSLRALSNAAKSALAGWKGNKRGRPARFALTALIHGLLSVFDREYRGSSSQERKRTGSRIDLSERDHERLEFVELAMDAAKIEHPDDLGPYFRQYAKSKSPAAYHTRAVHRRGKGA